MGIEQFFSSISENNITNYDSSFKYSLEKQISATYLCIDFNSIVHITSNSILKDLNYLLYHVIKGSYKLNQKVKKILLDYKLELNSNKDITSRDIVNIITPEVLDDIIINKVFIYMENMFSNFVVSKELQYIYIAVDGVPSKSKILEQKKRRHMGLFISDLKSKIFDYFSDELQKHNPIRYEYEILKFHWSKMYITPGTVFMDKINDMLSSQKFKTMITRICPNIKEYILSGVYEYGEGEKKIVDYLRSIKTNDLNTHVIYSPDSDVTLLGLLLNFKIKNLSIIRHNQQKDNYDIIYIDLLANNLSQYVINSIKNNSKNLNHDKLIDDIVFVLTIFGNDFLPKLESFTVKYDFNKIIDKYIQMLNNTNSYIINSNNSGKKTINQHSFVEMINILHHSEGSNLQHIYMVNQYQNYNKLKKKLNANEENFTDLLNNFLVKLRKFNYEIKTNMLNKNQWIDQEQDFILKLAQLTRLDNINNMDNINDFINKYITYYKQNNSFPRVDILFRRYKKTIKSQFHELKLTKVFEEIDPTVEITDYDKELYKLDNMLDEYVNKLNATSINLGYINIDPKTYKWKTEDIKKSVGKYYFDFFGINSLDIHNPEMNKLLSEYIEGLVWVFDYYFNHFNIKKNRDWANIWFYRYTHSPLLTQLYYFIKNKPKDYILNVQNGLKDYYVPRSNFFNCIEHLIYVTPYKAYSYVLPNEYYKYINKHPDIVNDVDINKIVNEVWNNDISDEIDCRGVIFLTKCHITSILITESIIKSYGDDLEFITDIRTIKISSNTKTLICGYNKNLSNVIITKF